MHITVYCPRCRSRYHLDPALRGQRMRCPNTVCREVFEVKEETPTDAVALPEALPPNTSRPDRAIDPPASAYSTGRVGEDIPLVPIEEERGAPYLEEDEPAEQTIPLLPADLVRQKRTDEPREARSWSEPPPIRRAPAGPTGAPPAVEEKLAGDRPHKPPRSPRRPRGAERGQPEERAAGPAGTGTVSAVASAEGDWEPPTVRRAAGAVAGLASPEESAPEAVVQRRRISSLIALLMVLLGVAVIGGGAWFVWRQFAATEEKQVAEARRDYDEGRFSAAAQKFRQLEKAFPKSPDHGLYRFFAHLSEVRHDAESLVESGVALERLEGFVQAHKDNPLLQDYRVDLWESTHKLLQGLIQAAREQKSRELLDTAGRVLELAEAFKPSGVDPARREQAEAAIRDVAKLLAREDERKRLLTRVSSLAATPENLRELENEIRDAGFGQDPEFQKALAHKREELRLQVSYKPAPAVIPRPVETARQIESAILATPLVRAPLVKPTPNGRVVLALVRGVLYGLDQGTGSVLWAMRVGIDMAALPVRLPPTDSTPEVFLVLSAERNTLRAVHAQSGEQLWEHQLSAPCLGRPTIIRRRVYVPTVAGRVEELEIIQGHQLGYFELPDQRLTVGGVWQPDTNLLYVPGDGQTVYVLDVVRKQCVATLDTGHPAGSLRAAPVLVNRVEPGNPEGAAPPAYLILCQADGLGAMKLRVFDVHPERKLSRPALDPEPRIRGWSWFPAYQDREKLAFVTDAGVLGPYGIRQYRNVDRAIFPELREEFQLGSPGVRPQRAQVVHAEENDFWVLANGHLQRLHLDRFAQKVAEVWPSPVALGSPLHEGQVDETGKVLFVVTQTEVQQTCLATAVRAADGQVLWQRQLGIECFREPLVVGQQVIAFDQGGGVFAFDPVKHGDVSGVEWVIGGQVLAPPLAEGMRWAQARASADRTSVTLAGTTASGEHLLVRRVQLGAQDQKPTPPERLKLPALLAGSPAIGPGHVLLLLKDGSLHRVSLTPAAAGSQDGPNWRSERADEDAVGHAVWLNAEEFLTTDGLRGLRRWRWPANDQFLPVGQQVLHARIVSPPVVLPNDQVCVADAQGRLTLLQGPKLKEVSSWQLEGQITAGPFLRGDRIGCVVDRRRLVWIDPSVEKVPLWEYSAREAIVGRPQLVGKLLVVADQAGRFIALDPATGRPHGPGYELRAGTAPGTSPVLYGADHALAPLADGTLFILPLAKLGTWGPEFPWLW